MRLRGGARSFFYQLKFSTMTKHITKITDLNKDEILRILEDAKNMQDQFEMTHCSLQYFRGKTLAMIFEKPSLRTRMAFEVAAAHMGGSAIYLASSDILASGSNVKGRESIPDIAKNLESFTDLILARVFSHSTILTLAENSHISVINGLCDLHHPTQTLADLYTISSLYSGIPKSLKIAYVGDGCNTANSLFLACDILGIHFEIATPVGYEMPVEIMKLAKGTDFKISHNPREVVKNADVVYTDTWVSMGSESEFERRLKDFAGYQVNSELLAHANKDVHVMHCLPAHRGEEITDEVIDGDHSIVFKQAAARLPVAKALLKFLFN